MSLKLGESSSEKMDKIYDSEQPIDRGLQKGMPAQNYDNEKAEESKMMSEENKSNEEAIYHTFSRTYTISFIEFAIINAYLYDVYRTKSDDIKVESYGSTDAMGRISYNGAFDLTNAWWFKSTLKDIKNEYFFQTTLFVDQGHLITKFSVSSNKGLSVTEFRDTFEHVKKLAFNNSEYKGKCIKVKLQEGRFNGIEIIDTTSDQCELILTSIQEKFIKHFINRVRRGKSTRYLLNGDPGTGKTACFRFIINSLIPQVTFIIPDFVNVHDLTTILEACEIFDNGVVIMDDVDLFLGSRDNGSYTRLLGEFLSFFDGVKKRKISLVASTNDKGLVDKAAERPGRFNLTLDFTHLDDEQIEKVCNIHMPVEYQVPAVYEVLKSTISGQKAKITGAFIANLADNVREMAQDDEEWSIQHTIDLIKESYQGFYGNQISKENGMGFIRK